MNTTISDADAATADITELLVAGLSGQKRARRELFGAGAVGAAVVLDQLRTQPRSVAYLARLVRAGGIACVRVLPEPLPTRSQTEAISPWISGVAAIPGSIATDDGFARWLDAVAAILAIRIEDRGQSGAR